MTPTFYQGQTIRLKGTFTDASGNLVDPSSVSASAYDPTGQTTNLSVVKESTGVYHADLTPSTSSKHVAWQWKMVGTGANAQVQYGSFKVLPVDF